MKIKADNKFFVKNNQQKGAKNGNLLDFEINKTIKRFEDY